MRFLLVLAVLLAPALLLGSLLPACSSGPAVSPSQCQDLCTAAKAPGVCWYSDDEHGSGTCVCKNDDGSCPAPAGVSDSGIPVTPGAQ
jgi:hypothetical protein